MMGLFYAFYTATFYYDYIYWKNNYRLIIYVLNVG